MFSVLMNRPLSVWITDAELGINSRVAKRTYKEQEKRTKLKRIKSRFGKIYFCEICKTYFNLAGQRIPKFCLFCQSLTGYQKKQRFKTRLRKPEAGFCGQCLQWPIKIEHKEWKLCSGCYSRLTQSAYKRKNESEERKSKWKE